MCGRFVVANVGSELVDVLRVDVEGEDLPAPSYNIAPTDRVAIVLDSAKSEPPVRRLESARWGLVPAWAKDPSVGVRAFNARSEEVEDKPMFRQALIKRRAVIPATGYYEWKTEDGVKTPHFIHPADGSPLLFAGLYEWWKDPGKADDDPARWLLSFTIMTRDAVGPLGSIHDRMPLFIDADHADAWLDPTTENVGDVLDAAIDAAPALAETLESYVVDRAVGNVRNNSPALIEPAS
ncbi:SOS response-associated peptidase [Microbacterium saccharophilum]|uniref:Abasic site processing protein n=1 Tax=Microbacterium saccharophilum TaxID=1213358 RepID=A0A5C8HV94_9MICO|nr:MULTISPECIES: SOS response-associated peptidase [Microbacterium]TXK09178.1 SOS response-associated peptidase [Microbacterium saccharophilum]SFI31557.1 Putative SOS response-associated peptidase YedK [Microbacterium saccharophilum]